jgi:hypothetical protein
MSISTRRELSCRVAARYQMSGRKEKSAILNEFTATTGCDRKYAIRRLNQMKNGLPPDPVKRTRKRWYGRDVEDALLVVWQAANFICAKRLIPFLPELIPAMERHGQLCVDAQTREKLLSMSSATADRLLKRIRDAAKPKGASTTRAGGLLKHQVPVRTFADWQDNRPGFVEADLVAHCGSRSDGAFLNTLVLTDVATTWTECLPLLYRSETEVIRSVECARRILPFKLLGLDTDNGSEFLNKGLFDYCEREEITFTRGRAYKKNDQCYVEQKNGVVVRQLVGYDRFEGSRAYQQLGELYQVIRLYVNFFQPSMKLIFKQRKGSRVRKKYDLAQTPYQRLVSSNILDEEKYRYLNDFYLALDPVQLLKQLEILQDAFWQHAILERPKVRLASRCIAQPEHVTANLTEEQKSPEKAGIEEEVKKQKKRRYRRTAKTRAPRTWRTRKDPFERVSDELRQELAAFPQRTAKSMLAELQDRYPGRFTISQLRTLQRRVKQWRLETLVKFDVEWLNVDSEFAVPSSAMPGNWDGSENHPCT